MATKIKCELILHGSSRQISMGEFESIVRAKQYVSNSGWVRPYTIKKLK